MWIAFDCALYMEPAINSYSRLVITLCNKALPLGVTPENPFWTRNTCNRSSSMKSETFFCPVGFVSSSSPCIPTCFSYALNDELMDEHQKVLLAWSLSSRMTRSFIDITLCLSSYAFCTAKDFRPRNLPVGCRISGILPLKVVPYTHRVIESYLPYHWHTDAYYHHIE